jgi:hypothetical protein
MLKESNWIFCKFLKLLRIYLFQFFLLFYQPEIRSLNEQSKLLSWFYLKLAYEEIRKQVEKSFFDFLCTEKIRIYSLPETKSEKASFWVKA